MLVVGVDGEVPAARAAPFCRRAQQGDVHQGLLFANAAGQLDRLPDVQAPPRRERICSRTVDDAADLQRRRRRLDGDRISLTQLQRFQLFAIPGQ